MPTPPKKKPAAKKPVKRQAKTKARAPKVAEMAASGASTSEIANEIGVSRTQVWRILNTEECQHLVITLVNSHFPVLESLFVGALAVIRDAMLADRPGVISKNGDFHEGGADHYARLTAVRQLIQILTAGRPKPNPAELPAGNRGRMTLGQIQAQIQGHDEATPDTGSDRATQLAR